MTPARDRSARQERASQLQQSIGMSATPAVIATEASPMHHEPKRMSSTLPMLVAVALVLLASNCAPRNAISAAVPAIFRYDLQNATQADPPITLLLDTATGRCWEMLYDEQGNLAWFGTISLTPSPDGDASEISRFRFVASGAKRTGTFILDTATGKMWAFAGNNELRRSTFVAVAVEGLHQ